MNPNLSMMKERGTTDLKSIKRGVSFYFNEQAKTILRDIQESSEALRL